MLRRARRRQCPVPHLPLSCPKQGRQTARVPPLAKRANLARGRRSRPQRHTSSIAACIRARQLGICPRPDGLNDTRPPPPRRFPHPDPHSRHTSKCYQWVHTAFDKICVAATLCAAVLRHQVTLMCFRLPPCTGAILHRRATPAMSSMSMGVEEAASSFPGRPQRALAEGDRDAPRRKHVLRGDAMREVVACAPCQDLRAPRAHDVHAIVACAHWHDALKPQDSGMAVQRGVWTGADDPCVGLPAFRRLMS